MQLMFPPLSLVVMRNFVRLAKFVSQKMCSVSGTFVNRWSTVFHCFAWAYALHFRFNIFCKVIILNLPAVVYPQACGNYSFQLVSYPPQSWENGAANGDWTGARAAAAAVVVVVNADDDYAVGLCVQCCCVLLNFYYDN